MLKQSEVEISRPLAPRTTTKPSLETSARKPNRSWVALLVLCVIGAGAFLGIRALRQHRAATSPNPSAARGGNFPIPVVAATVKAQDVPIYLDGIGTVQAFNTVTVRSRVDGQIKKIFFTEGQDVKAGDPLALIDPAPFQAQLDQSVAKKAEDEAQLAVARVNLKRDVDLLASKILAQQDYDAQQALVAQLAATVQADQAAVENAQVQLNYTQVTSPLDGRVGIRQVDNGNIVHANDSNGLVVITQLRPIAVVFTLAEKFLSQVQDHLGPSEELTVVAVDHNNKRELGRGKLAVVDNQIDTTTGTIRLKAIFPNEDLRLWPGQFVNARLLLTVMKGGTVVPAQVIQQGPDGAYAFVIEKDLSVSVRPVKVGPIENNMAMIEEGLGPGEQVVSVGQFKLKPGSHVRLGDAPTPGAGGSRTNRPSGAKRSGAPASAQ